jgi:hypothetical protein
MVEESNMTPEAKVKLQVKKVLGVMGAYYAMPVTGGYGVSGVPDFLVCYNGLFVGLECKAGKGKTTALQEKHLSDIREAGGAAHVINEANISILEDLLNGTAESEQPI